jgi:hypothetical protein
VGFVDCANATPAKEIATTERESVQSWVSMVMGHLGVLGSVDVDYQHSA